MTEGSGSVRLLKVRFRSSEMASGRTNPRAGAPCATEGVGGERGKVLGNGEVLMALSVKYSGSHSQQQSWQVWDSDRILWFERSERLAHLSVYNENQRRLWLKEEV